jgi:hypothetical protein
MARRKSGRCHAFVTGGGHKTGVRSGVERATTTERDD